MQLKNQPIENVLKNNTPNVSTHASFTKDLGYYFSIPDRKFFDLNLTEEEKQNTPYLVLVPDFFGHPEFTSSINNLEVLESTKKGKSYQISDAFKALIPNKFDKSLNEKIQARFAASPEFIQSSMICGLLENDTILVINGIEKLREVHNVPNKHFNVFKQTVYSDKPLNNLFAVDDVAVFNLLYNDGYTFIIDNPDTGSVGCQMVLEIQTVNPGDFPLPTPEVLSQSGVKYHFKKLVMKMVMYANSPNHINNLCSLENEQYQYVNDVLNVFGFDKKKNLDKVYTHYKSGLYFNENDFYSFLSNYGVCRVLNQNDAGREFLESPYSNKHKHNNPFNLTNLGLFQTTDQFVVETLIKVFEEEKAKGLVNELWETTVFINCLYWLATQQDIFYNNLYGHGYVLQTQMNQPGNYIDKSELIDYSVAFIRYKFIKNIFRMLADDNRISQAFYANLNTFLTMEGLKEYGVVGEDQEFKPLTENELFSNRGMFTNHSINGFKNDVQIWLSKYIYMDKDLWVLNPNKDKKLVQDSREMLMSELDKIFNPKYYHGDNVKLNPITLGQINTF